MQIDKKIRVKTLIVAFPSFGFVGNIALEFLKEHLKTEEVGKIFIDNMHPIIAIHKGELIEPISLYYNRKYQIALLQGISKPLGFENEIGNKIALLVKKFNVKEVITIDGVGAVGTDIYFYSKINNKDKLKKCGLKQLNDGVVLGVTSALLMRIRNITSLFVETQSQLPDSNAAARAIKALDKYLKLNVDYEPLIEQAKKFEKKLNAILAKNNEAKQKQDLNKNLNYFG